MASAPADSAIARLLATTKACTHCGAEKPGSDFTIGGKSRGKLYLQGICKPCKAEKERVRRESDPKYRERLRVQSRKKYDGRQAASLEAA